MLLWLPPVAFIFDLLFPDPKNLPHPVQGIGFLANRLEAPARGLGRPFLAGLLVMVLLLLITGGIAGIAINLPFGLGCLATLYLAWAGLALGGLLRDGKAALKAIQYAYASAGTTKEEKTLFEARYHVQMLVSRDTSKMSIPELYRSLAESLSENLNDAFIAPYFWLVLGGPVGIWLYKAVSTMDSMWGYKTERWLYLGRTAARLDDLLAFIPARLTVICMYISVWVEELFHEGTDHIPLDSRWPGWYALTKEAKQSESPNAGWPMAAAAWLFGGKTGGPTVYDGEIKQKPFMGPEHGAWQDENTAMLLRHIQRTGIVFMLLCLTVSYGITAILL